MKNKVVVITGASSGIGRALAIEYARHGAKLVLGARRIDRLTELEKELHKTKIISIKTDVSIENDCKQLIDATIKKFGRIDVLINNAGISMRALFADLDLSVMQRLMEVNFWGTVFCTKYALPHLLKTRGSVVGIISIAGYIGLPGRTAYSASKYAIRGFLDALRTENIKTGLHVLVAAPGFTTSEVRQVALTANGKQQGKTPRDESKMMSAKECARHIIKAVNKRDCELILTFTEGKLAVFLNKFMPKFLARMAYKHMAKEPDSPFK